MISVSDVLALAKGAGALAKKINNSELRAEVLDLQQRALDLQTDVASLLEENRELRDRLALRDMKLRDDGMYYDAAGDGPFCPGCVDGKGIRARVSQRPANKFWICTVCEKTPPGAPLPPGWGEPAGSHVDPPPRSGWVRGYER